uniref:BHLH domain-containing protein n=1 Tax=Ditylenchus dipsaci TaxID=166011 RepID=A0A915DJR9_9BILA
MGQQFLLSITSTQIQSMIIKMQSATSSTRSHTRTVKREANANLRLVSHGSVVKTRTYNHQQKNSGLFASNTTPATSSKHNNSTIAGKTPHQVQRRNERERRRVQAVNRGYEVLAHQLADWEELKNKKLTKAQTLKAAILYIQHMEKLITTNGCTQSSMSFSPSQLAFLDDIENDSEAEEDHETDENHRNSSSYPVALTSMPSPEEKKPFPTATNYQAMPFNNSQSLNTTTPINKPKS